MKQIFLLALFSLLLLAACGRDEETSTPAPTNPPASTNTAVPPTAPPVPTKVAVITKTTSATTTTSVTASTTSTKSRSAPISPLANPVSPLAKPVSPTTTPMTTPVSIVVPASKVGTASVTGRLTSKITGQPLNHAVVRLAGVYCPSAVAKADTRAKCVWALDGAFSPSTFTDAVGNFVFTDVPPRQYIVLIGDMVMKYTVINDDKNRPMMWTVEANKVVKTGDFAVDY